jgi:hypothetical protein
MYSEPVRAVLTPQNTMFCVGFDKKMLAFVQDFLLALYLQHSLAFKHYDKFVRVFVVELVGQF